MNQITYLKPDFAVEQAEHGVTNIYKAERLLLSTVFSTQQALINCLTILGCLSPLLQPFTI